MTTLPSYDSTDNEEQFLDFDSGMTREVLELIDRLVEEQRPAVAAAIHREFQESLSQARRLRDESDRLQALTKQLEKEITLEEAARDDAPNGSSDDGSSVNDDRIVVIDVDDYGAESCARARQAVAKWRSDSHNVEDQKTRARDERQSATSSQRTAPKTEAANGDSANSLAARPPERSASAAQLRDPSCSVGPLRIDTNKNAAKPLLSRSESDRILSSRSDTEKSTKTGGEGDKSDGVLRFERNDAGTLIYELGNGIRLAVGMSLLVRRTGGAWNVATLREYVVRDGTLKVKMAFPRSTKVKLVGLRAVADTRTVREADMPIRIGTRIVAPVRQGRPDAAGTKQLQRELRAGFIGELPNGLNEYRVLVLFECGAAHYARLDELHFVLEQSPSGDVLSYLADVNGDIPEENHRFLEFYFSNYPLGCRMNVQKGSTIALTDGRVMSVTEVKGSLLRVQCIQKTTETEWLHRCSPRIRAIHNEIRKWFDTEKKKLDNPRACLRRSIGAGAFVETVRIGWQPIDYVYVPSVQAQEQAREASSASSSAASLAVAVGPNGIRLPTARKSTAAAATKDYHRHVEVARAAQKREREQHGKVVRRDDLPIDSALQATKYKPHDQCKPSCLSRSGESFELLAGMRDENPLCIPLRLGWRRELQIDMPIGEVFTLYSMQMSASKFVLYVAPCGRRLRNSAELEKYLADTDSCLEMDLFSFLLKDHPFRYFKISKPMYYCDDLSGGKERVPISVVNCLQHDKPPFIEYVIKPYACPDVLRPGGLNLDENFLAGCDCTDNCRDKSKCACQQYTMSNACDMYGMPNPDAVYTHKRLLGQVSTGLFECNPHCKCDKRCNNRVVQNGMRQRLQLFRTEWKGWGVRCLDDVPRGAFVCTYVGELMRDETANDQGLDYGDEYLANLDLIELIEGERQQNKADYQAEINAADRELLELLASSSDENDSDTGETRRSRNRTERNPSHAQSSSSPPKSKVSAKAELQQQIAAHLNNVNGLLKKRLLECIRKVFGGNRQRIRALFESVRNENSVSASGTEKSVATRDGDEEEALCKEALKLVFKNLQPTSKSVAPENSHQDSEAALENLSNEMMSRICGDETTKPKRKGRKPLRSDDATSTSDSDLEAASDFEPRKTRSSTSEIPNNNTDGSSSENEKPRCGRPRKSTAGASALRKYTLLNNTRQLAGDRGPTAALSSRLDTLKQIVSDLRVQSERLISENQRKSDSIADWLSSQLLVSANVAANSGQDSSVNAPEPSADATKLSCPPILAKPETNALSKEPVSLRKAAFGDDEPFVMDSRKRGNIGRYLNHSCEPNLFVQNVFIDTHDMRFPSIAFFAFKSIKAGSELCWDYHYPVGQVEGKEIMCYCGAKNCCGRIL